MARTPKGISEYFNSAIRRGETPGTDLILREAFLRQSRDVLDNFGIEQYSVEQIRGMLELLEQYRVIQEEV